MELTKDELIAGQTYREEITGEKFVFSHLAASGYSSIVVDSEGKQHVGNVYTRIEAPKKELTVKELQQFLQTLLDNDTEGGREEMANIVRQLKERITIAVSFYELAQDRDRVTDYLKRASEQEAKFNQARNGN